MEDLIKVLSKAQAGFYASDIFGCAGGLVWQEKRLLTDNSKPEGIGSWHCSSAVFWGLAEICREVGLEEIITFAEMRTFQQRCWNMEGYRAGAAGGIVELEIGSWIHEGTQLEHTPTLKPLDVLQYWKQDFKRGHAAICIEDLGDAIKAWSASPIIEGDQPNYQVIKKSDLLWWVARLDPEIFHPNGGA